MFYTKATIQYEGCDYAGFQFQKNALTVQEVLNTTLKEIYGKTLTTVAASRTDAGVHALEQIIKITSPNCILDHDRDLINRYLPASIRILKLATCEAEFRPTSSSRAKEYCYLFTNKKFASWEERKFISNIANPLNLEAMDRSMKLLKGVHNFVNFYSTGSNVTSTVREIYECEMSVIKPSNFFSQIELFNEAKNLNECYQIRIKASGFLKQMVRHLVAALWRVGSGKLSEEQFMNLLHGPKSTQQLWRVAAPGGLYLKKIYSLEILRI
jgi:tRNA pseudouridine38-40 synthase